MKSDENPFLIQKQFFDFKWDSDECYIKHIYTRTIDNKNKKSRNLIEIQSFI